MKVNVHPVLFLQGLVISLSAMALTSAIFGFIVMLLWNWLIPVVCPEAPIVHTISWTQGWAISYLCSILFK